MRYAAKTDGNQAEIVQGLEDIGASVQSLAPVGEGVPDLLVGWRGANYLMEVKLPKKKGQRETGLNARQVAWHAKWRGQKAVVKTLEEALAVLGIALSPDHLGKVARPPSRAGSGSAF